jgi:hypothetical protein
MTSINPINVNTQGVGARTSFGAKPQAEKEEGKKAEAHAGAEKAQVSPDKVFEFLSAGAVNQVARKSVNPAKYVDSASQARIESFMASFEDKVAEGLKAFDKEFAGVNISDNAKMAVVLKGVEQEA